MKCAYCSRVALTDVEVCNGCGAPLPWGIDTPSQSEMNRRHQLGLSIEEAIRNLDIAFGKRPLVSPKPPQRLLE